MCHDFSDKIKKSTNNFMTKSRDGGIHILGKFQTSKKNWDCLSSQNCHQQCLAFIESTKNLNWYLLDCYTYLLKFQKIY